MDEKRCCGTCKWRQHEDVDDGWVCVNSDSEYCTDWTALTGISSKEERDAVCLALFHAGYEVRQTTRKCGGQTVVSVEVDVEYRR